MQHFFVQDVLHSEDEPEKLRQLHEQNAETRWFNIRNRNSQPMLYVYDRFGSLCKSVLDGGSEAPKSFPTIVSFIGKSGVGKSTLIRAMLLLGNLDLQQVQADEISLPTANQSRMEAFRKARWSQGAMPVTRSGHINHLVDPTTLGVHLYRDGGGSTAPHSNSDDFNLFTDCEGFFTGATQTNAERLTADRSRTPVNEDAAESNLLYREPVTADSYTKYGQEGAELYYAKFLYSVSDVVVFVTNEDQNITRLLVSALEWAAAAILHSVNYPSRKTLIIVRNGAIGRSQQIIDSESLEQLYLERQKMILWKTSNILQEFVKDYNSRQDKYSRRIYDNRDLYDVLFHKTICFCIPHLIGIEEYGDETMFTQYLKLRTLIDDSCQRAIDLRSKMWMKYNVSSFSQMLFAAFEHFRINDKPFNFSDVARISKPSPQSLPSHIANYLRLALDDQESSEESKAMIPDIIALSLVVWSLRTLDYVVDPEHLFDTTVNGDENNVSFAKHCHSAVQEYQEKYQLCGYQFHNKEFCINGPEAAHQQLHLSASRKQAGGAFAPRRRLDVNLVTQIRDQFMRHYDAVVTEDEIGQRSMTKPPLSRSRRIREAIMQTYSRLWRSITSNTTCLSCLQAAPENVLHCGHGYCVQCVRELGRASNSFESSWTFEVCPLCCARVGDNYSHLIREPPRCAGIRILTLDGGGVRGIIELALIRELENRLGLGIPFRDYFDLVFGTSTGGIVGLAIAMGDKDANTDINLLTKSFKSFASATFARPQAGRLLTRIGLGHFITSVVMSCGLYQALFDSAPLQAGLKKFFGDHTSLFGSARTRHHQCSTRVAVIATKEFGEKPHLITSYNRSKVGADSDFDREDDETKGMKIWEAGLATSAAPVYLPPFKKAETGIVYFDGALHMNCPAPGAVEEVRKIWPEHTPSVDVLLSIGTGIQEAEVKIPKAIRIGGFAEICRSFHRQLDCEHQWDQFVASGASTSIRDRLYRLNPPIDEHLQKVTLWQWDKMDKLEAMVERQMEETVWASRVSEVANALLANLFYFEPAFEAAPSFVDLASTGRRQTEAVTEIQGTIRTRLRHGSLELRRLLNRVGGLSYTKLSALSREKTSSAPVKYEPWAEITAFTTIKEQVKQSRQPFRVPVRFSEESEAKSILVAVRFKDSRVPVPISGFPASLHELHTKAKSWD